MTMPVDMDAKEADAIAAAVSVDVFIFSKLSLPRPVGDADSPCCHYRNMKMVWEPLQHRLVLEVSLEFLSLLFRLFIIFSFSLFFQPISCNDFQDACAFYRKMSFYQHFLTTRQPYLQNQDLGQVRTSHHGGIRRYQIVEIFMLYP